MCGGQCRGPHRNGRPLLCRQWWRTTVHRAVHRRAARRPTIRRRPRPSPRLLPCRPTYEVRVGNVELPRVMANLKLRPKADLFELDGRFSVIAGGKIVLTIQVGELCDAPPESSSVPSRQGINNRRLRQSFTDQRGRRSAVRRRGR